MTPVPLVGSACDLINGINKGDVGEIIFGSVFLVVDTLTFGLGHYIGAGSKVGKKSVSELARRVQKGGKITKGVKIGSL